MSQDTAMQSLHNISTELTLNNGPIIYKFAAMQLQRFMRDHLWFWQRYQVRQWVPVFMCNRLPENRRYYENAPTIGELMEIMDMTDMLYIDMYISREHYLLLEGFIE